MDSNQDSSSSRVGRPNSPNEELVPGEDGRTELSEAQPEMGWGTMPEADQGPYQGHFPSFFPDFPPLPDLSTIANPQGQSFNEWAHDQSALAEITQHVGDDSFDYFPDAQFESGENVEADELRATLLPAPESSAGPSSKLETQLKGKSKPRPKKPTTRPPALAATPKSPTTTSSSSSKSRQLRTAVRKPAVAGFSHQAAASSPTQGDEEAATKRRRTHNTVEKRYRGRLNEQFESLLDALPPRSDDPTSPTSAVGGDDKRLSKGAVLDMAQKRIQELQDEHAVLMAENEALREKEEDIIMRTGWDLSQDRGRNTEPDASGP